MLKSLERARVTFGNDAARIRLSSLTSGYGEFILKIPCRDLDWQVSSLEQVCTSVSSLPPLSTLEVLYIHSEPLSQPQPNGRDNIENALWLELLHPFPAVKNLYLCREFASRIVPALQEVVGGRTTEVLPTLQNIFVDKPQLLGPVREGIQQFVAARQVTNHPITINPWDDSDLDMFWGTRDSERGLY
jgi:hypothetical protein